ncbi:MAG: hypothetical protein R3C14_31595 [Caldilineaceae bacterium]
MFDQNNFDQRKVRWIIGGIVALVLLGGIASAIRQAGWNEGYMMGLMTSNGNGRELAPYVMRHGYGPWGGGFHAIFGIFGFFFRLIFFVFFLGLIAKVLGFWRWRAHGPHHAWHQHHGPWAGPQNVPPTAPTGEQKTTPPTTQASEPTGPVPTSQPIGEGFGEIKV